MTLIDKDKENQVYHTPPLKRKSFRTPPLKEQNLKEHKERIPLGGKYKIRTPIRSNNKIQSIQTPIKLNEYDDDDLKLDKFLKIAKGDDIDIEIKPKHIDSLKDKPDDCISFDELNLHKIYSPFHVPELDQELDKVLDLQFDDCLKWDLSTPVSVIKKLNEIDMVDKTPVGESPMDKTKHTPLQIKQAKNTPIQKHNPDTPIKNTDTDTIPDSGKRFMTNTQSSKIKMTPLDKSRKISQLQTPNSTRNLLNELNELNDISDDDLRKLF